MKLIKKNNKKGFTLVELVIVIAILAILALILVPAIGKYIGDANNSKGEASTRTIYTTTVLQQSLTPLPVGALTPAIAVGDKGVVATTDSNTVKFKKEVANAANLGTGETISVVIDANGAVEYIEFTTGGKTHYFDGKTTVKPTT